MFILHTIYSLVCGLVLFGETGRISTIEVVKAPIVPVVGDYYKKRIKLIEFDEFGIIKHSQS